MSIHSIENEESKENTGEKWSEILEKRISELIDRVSSLQKEIEDLSGPIHQLLKDIRISIYELDSPFSYVSQVAQRRQEEVSLEEDAGKPKGLKKEKEPSRNDLLKTLSLMHKMSLSFDLDIPKILDLLTKADLLPPETADFLMQILKPRTHEHLEDKNVGV